MKPLFVFILFALSSLTATAQHQHTEHLDALVSEYLKMKDSLAKDHFEDAKKYLYTFAEEVKTNEEMNDHPEHSGMHQAHHNAMLAAVESASGAENIDQLRDSFNEISTELLKALENQGYDNETLYVQFCPMANNGEGARWISNQETIINPFMGQSMPGCGKTEKKIERDDK